VQAFIRILDLQVILEMDSIPWFSILFAERLKKSQFMKNIYGIGYEI